MARRVVLVHYHEIALKGKNRSTFEKRLIQNLRHALRELPVGRVGRISGHILLTLEDESRAQEVAAAARQVPGVARVSLAFACARDADEFCQAAVDAMGEVPEDSYTTFKVHARKSSTDFPMHTIDMNRLVGGVLCEHFSTKKVQMRNPDVTVCVYMVQGTTYVYALSEPGVGGLPVGSAGKVVSLLSSGIDSPVASWLVGRRGAIVVGVHFSGRPVTADTSEYLVRDICDALAPSGIVGRLYVFPFGEIQHQIALAVPQGLRVIMYRRMMFALAERVARLEHAKAIVTGESLGQVASQTLENIAAVDEVVSMPVLRPLIGSDKQEIIRRAQQIGTFEISTEEAPDCCTLFMPRQPETHARLDDVHAAEKSFDFDALLEEAWSLMEHVDFDQCPSYKGPKL